MKCLTQLSVVLVVLVALATAPVDLRAATITVTSTADNGSGTLRAAFASAANGDTINFALPMAATITLTSGELLISRNVNKSTRRVPPQPSTGGVSPGW